MRNPIDLILTNEYFFTFFCTFLSVLIKGMSTKNESIKAIFKSESVDMGPELILIALSFLVSLLSKVYENDMPESYLNMMHWLLMSLFLLILIVVIIKRISSKAESKLYTLWIPLIIGFFAVYLAISYSINL